MWFKRKRASLRTEPDQPAARAAEPEPRPTIPLPADTLLDRDVALFSERQKQLWVDDAYEKFVSSGGLDHLPGKGKPLVIPEGNVMDSILRNAGVPHPWVLLRQTIRDDLEETLRLLERKPEDPQIEEKLSDINRRIVQMNMEAPSLTLHRRKVTRDTLREQLEKWR